MSFKPSTHQAAGHAGSMTDEDGGLFIKITNQQEIDFYNSIYKKEQEEQENGEESTVGSQLVDWIPRFYGTLADGNQTDTLTGSQPPAPPKGKKYIVLENLYSGYSKPSIIDIKLGRVLTDEAADIEKQERLRKVSESTTSGTHHFRICGMKLYNQNLKDLPSTLTDLYHTISVCPVENEDDVYLEFDKFFGRSLTGDNVKEAIKVFLSNALPPNLYASIVDAYVKRLQLLYNCLMTQEVRIIAGSLLFIVENDLARYPDSTDEINALNPLVKPALPQNTDDDDDDVDDDDEEEVEGMIPLSSLNFIDLAHAKYVPGEGYDENIIVGVENLLVIFEELLDEISLPK